ncbi:MAG: hypothetical protein RMM58_09705 [Chloroflexota bacterium]|nr:hypothetical protein [Dehalococcoidia bacterium]MDW8254143.1 hypothetical protein [Chloroflexota bacterium]
MFATESAPLADRRLRWPPLPDCDGLHPDEAVLEIRRNNNRRFGMRAVGTAARPQ